MAKLSRIVARIFGSGAGVDQIAQFGSLLAGSPAFTTDPAVAQSLSNWLTGWSGAAIGGNAPAIEDMNAVCFVLAYQVAYMMQAGIPEWNTDTVYYIGSLTQVAGVTYVSRTDNNQGNLVTDATNWKKIGGDILTALGDTLYGGVNGAQTRLAGNTSATPTIMTQTGDGLGASAAPVWRPFIAPTIQKLTTSGTYTRPSSPVPPLYLKVKMVAASGGGGASGAGGVAGGDGGDTSFGTSLLSVKGGKGGAGGSTTGAGGAGGAGGSLGGLSGFIVPGGAGTGGGGASTQSPAGGGGGVSPFGGAGGGGSLNGGGADPLNAGANTGSGGGGGSSSGCTYGGGGGGAGEYLEAIIPNPGSSYAFVIGALGAGGTSGNQNGGDGSKGLIIVEEHYQ